MEILPLRTVKNVDLMKHFTEHEVGALREYVAGKNRNAAMMDFAARCYSQEEPILSHPLGAGDSRCTHSNSIENVYNTLHFSGGIGEEFIVVQRVTFMDALIFPGRGVALIIRSIKEGQLAAVVGSLERIRTKHPEPRRFAGFVVAHHRPYHYFYESLPAMHWFDRKVRQPGVSAPSVDLVQLTGGDYFPISALFPGMTTYTVSSSVLNWTNKIAGTFFVKLGYSGMWDQDPSQIEAIANLDTELRTMFSSGDIDSDGDHRRRTGVLFDVSDAKGTWETIAEDIPVIVGQLIDRLGREVDVYLDGWTLAATPTSAELKTARQEAKLARAIGMKLPAGVGTQSLVGASPYAKMSFMRSVDVAVCRFSTGSLIPSRVMHKPGIVHHSGEASIFSRLHFHGPGMTELRGKPTNAHSGVRDQDISYTLDSAQVATILGDILEQKKAPSM